MPKKGSYKPEKAKFLSREQVAALLRGPREADALRDYYLLASAYYLARRVGEVVMLRPDHFASLDMGEIMVPLLKRLRTHRCRPGRCPTPCPDFGLKKWPRGMLKDPVSGHPLKVVPVVDGTPIFKAMLAWAGPREWIFPGRRGHLKVRRAELIFRMWAQAAGIHDSVTIHSLRHTATTFVVERAGLAMGRDLAAHANIATTDAYTHRTPEGVLKAKGSLDV